MVEDDALATMEIELMLGDAGYRITGIADDVESPIDTVNETKPELALVDMHLAAGASGLDVAKALGERDIPVVFATGNCPGDKGADLALGCMHKPIVDSSLRTAITAARAAMDGGALPSLPASVHFYAD